MKAFICDRCMRAYQIESVTNLQATNHVHKVKSLGGNLRLDIVNLCPKCASALDEWIENGIGSNREGKPENEDNNAETI